MCGIDDSFLRSNGNCVWNLRRKMNEMRPTGAKTNGQPDTAQDDVSPLVGQSHYCIKSTQNPMFSWTWRKPKQNFKTQPKNEWSGWTGNMTSLADVGPPVLAMCQPRGTQAKSGRWRQTWCMIIPWFSIELTFSNKHVMPNHIL